MLKTFLKSAGKILLEYFAYYAIAKIEDIVLVKLKNLVNKIFLKNLISLILFLMGIAMVYLFPNNHTGLYIFSVFLLISLVYKSYYTVKHIILWIYYGGDMICSIISIIAELPGSAIKFLWEFIKRIIFALLPNVMLLLGYIIATNMFLKPVLLEVVSGISSSRQLYLCPILLSIDFIFKTNTLSWIGL